MRITVIGGGSWGTALVKILSENNTARIKWWMRDKEMVQHIRTLHHNPKYLSSVEFHPSRVKAYNNLKNALKETEWVVLAIPAAFLEEAIAELKPKHFEGKKIVSAIKGIIPSKNELVTDFMCRQFGVPLEEQAIIAGPCHAEEVAQEKQSYLTIAGPSQTVAQSFATLLACRYVKTQAITDIYGAEYSAIIKNIVALASGITHGLGAGDNFQAVLISNAMLEIERVVNRASQASRNLLSSAYLGDLLVTAYSQFSRNRAFGNMIGRGYTVHSAQLEMNMIAEGYYAVNSLYQVVKSWDLELPIIEFTYNVLYKKNSLKKEFSILKNRLV
ncbi:NAD(P)H-dependent glycerol-3-phosphate dehydrogenase [Marinilongibacter aquaticus]|uniref:NAD(P)H-dependent glycerol-3-phosphate dehydrogenase n=1 Tax=Marinilongibacter aquaticus TaxID=2975157 RepID=UPI0021BD430F|nr:NAD(P)H-dependent glycerol-3-phosphate dehydrogenase [Marinilongibacter aquaticus]UBM60912.1 NAD(P)H-dependent glycerol-3-phosphate dehydrogenase [Marinilongibacter aquaticus]